MRPTFSLSVVSRRERYHSEEKRAALAISEALHNAEAQKADQALLFNFSKDAKRYLAIAHNGNPFDDVNDLKTCMRPSTTGGEGVQGSGMKAAMFLLTEKPAEAELVIHSHDPKGAFTVKLTPTNFNEAKIEDVSNEWHLEVQNVLGKSYDQLGVVYFYRYTNSHTKEHKGNYGNGLLKPSYARLLTELAPHLPELIKIKAKYNRIYGKLCKQKCLDDESHETSTLQPLSKIDAEFCTDCERFKVSTYVELDGEKQQFDGVIDIKVYPNLKNDLSRLVVINGPDAGGTRNNTQHSAESLFVSCDFHLPVDCNKDLSRASVNICYSSLQVYENLTLLGLYCSRQAKFNNKIDEYWKDLSVQHPNLKIQHWEPVVKTFVRIIPKSEQSILECGGLNEFFQAEDEHKVRKIVRSLFDELAKTNPGNLIALRERMKRHFPYDKTDLVPLPKNLTVAADHIINVLRQVSDEDGNNSWEIVRDIEPGSHVNFAKLEYKDGKSVIEPVLSASDGVSLKHEYDNLYTIIISPLVRVESNGKKIPINVNDYRHTKEFLPKKISYCDVGNDQYSFSFRINIPKRDYGGGGGRNSVSGIDKRSEDDSIDMYQEMECGLYGMYAGGNLLLNRANPVIVQAASFSKEQHPALYQRWLSLYKRANEIARVAHNITLELLQVDYTKAGKSEAEKYGSPEQCFVNSHLRIVFEGDEFASLLKDVNYTKQASTEKAA